MYYYCNSCFGFTKDGTIDDCLRSDHDHSVNYLLGDVDGDDEVCGAVSGMFMVFDTKYGYISPTDTKSKKELYCHIQKLAGEFEQENGSIICRELLGLSEKSSSPNPDKRTNEYYKKRPCKELVELAANIVDNYMKKL